MPEQETELAELQARAIEFVQQARASATRKAYATDWNLFDAWCRSHGKSSLPATPATLALYLTQLAVRGRKYSTIRRARTAIGQVHCAANVDRPDLDRHIRTLEHGIGRTIGTRERGATPLRVPELERVIETLQSGSSRDARDRAMLLLGFACGYRSSDLVALDVEDIRFEGAGMYVILARSKEDLLARGRTTNVPAATNANLCPVRAMGRWLEVAALQTGPLFRMIQGSQIGASRMHPRAVSRALQRGVKRAGLSGAYSSHSLRAGLAAAADARGHSPRAIQEHVGWLDARTPSRYIDTNKAKRSSSVLHGLL